MQSLVLGGALLAMLYSLRCYRAQHRRYGSNRWAHVRQLAQAGAWMGLVGYAVSAQPYALLGSFLFVLLMLVAWALALRHDEARLQALEARAGGGVPALVAAARERDYEMMGRLIAAGAEVDARSPEGVNAYAVCVRRGDLRGLRLLLVAGAKPSQPVAEGLSGLMWAARAGRTALARILLDAGAEPNRAGPNGETALGLACAGGHEETMALLLGREADVDRPSLHGHTPLMRASASGNARAVRLLLERGARAACRSPGEPGESALSLAVDGGYANCVGPLVDALLNAGENEPAREELIGKARGRSYNAIAELLEKLPGPGEADAAASLDQTVPANE